MLAIFTSIAITSCSLPNQYKAGCDNTSKWVIKTPNFSTTQKIEMNVEITGSKFVIQNLCYDKKTNKYLGNRFIYGGTTYGNIKNDTKIKFLVTSKEFYVASIGMTSLKNLNENEYFYLLGTINGDELTIDDVVFKRIPDEPENSSTENDE